MRLRPCRSAMIALRVPEGIALRIPEGIALRIPEGIALRIALRPASDPGEGIPGGPWKGIPEGILFRMRSAIAVQVEQQQAQLGLAVEVEMLEGAAQVGLDRLRREPQLAGDLTVGPAADRQPGDLALARRQAGQGVLGPPAASLMLQPAAEQIGGQALQGMTVHPG